MARTAQKTRTTQKSTKSKQSTASPKPRRVAKTPAPQVANTPASSKSKQSTASPKRRRISKTPSTQVANTPASEQEYLATELGHSVDHEGEPMGLDFPLLRRDTEFREFTMSLWRQFQASRTLSNSVRELEQEGLTQADLWEPGITEFFPTSSTPEQMRRYKQKLLFRASFLEAVLTETIAELKKLDRAKPMTADDEGN